VGEVWDEPWSDACSLILNIKELCFQTKALLNITVNDLFPVILRTMS
jgi:hypothetical protein